ncbi:copper homeostasis protein CutC [Leucobacter sp. HY1910]
MTRSFEYEIIAQDPAAVRLAARLGATRVELCQGLALGGITPSAGLVEAAVAASRASATPTHRVEVHALIRPRSGGFVYSDDELDVIVADIRAAVRSGVDGVVVGNQLASGELDLEALARMREAAGDAQLSLHRVVDVTPDPVATVASLVARADLGVARVLTSGGAPRAIEGAATLARMVAAASGRIAVMAGSGVNAQNVAELWATGVDAVHFSAKRDVVERPIVSMGSSDADGVGGYEVTCEDTARAVIAALTGRAA